MLSFAIVEDDPDVRKNDDLCGEGAAVRKDDRFRCESGDFYSVLDLNLTRPN